VDQAAKLRLRVFRKSSSENYNSPQRASLAIDFRFGLFGVNELSGSELSWADPDENGRLEVGHCVALDVVANMIAVFFRREPSSHPFPRVNTQPIALNTRLAFILAVLSRKHFPRSTSLVRNATIRKNSLAFGHHEDRTPTHGYAATREAAMAAFAKSWRQE
jgi:hypothetical protein